MNKLSLSLLLVACAGPNGVISIRSVTVSVVTRIERQFPAAYVDDEAVTQAAKDHLPLHSEYSQDFETPSDPPRVMTCGTPRLYWQLDETLVLPEQDGTVQLSRGGVREDGVGSGADTLTVDCLGEAAWVVSDDGTTTAALTQTYDLPETLGHARATETRTVTFATTQVDVRQYDSCGDLRYPIY